MTDDSQTDVTVLRLDNSVSRSGSGEGSGEADAPRVLKQRFVLEEKLGSGGMGTVFRAKDLRKVEARDRQPYLAVKVLNNDFREHSEAFIALQREAAKSQSLSHRNIVSIYDFDKDGDVPFITMELLEGQELAELLRAYPTGMPEPMAWEVIRGICAGLRHAHEAGIVHADFKPGNVFVSPTNAPKILDFGIARAFQLTEGHGEDTLFEPTRLAALTPAYASREMLSGDNPEPRDDLYSLGVVIYLILTGRHPYGRLSADDAAKEGLKPERPKGISRRQWQVIARCLAFNRQDRPRDMAEVEHCLLMPSPWRSRSAVAAALAFGLALTVNYMIDDAELSEVKQEVRQTTLLDAQLARIGELLDHPVFDDNWEARIATEYRTLEELQGAERSESGDEPDYSGRVREQIAQAYAARIAELEDLTGALALLERGERFGPLPAAAAGIEQKAIVRIRDLLDNARPDERWLADLQAELAGLHDAFPNSQALAELDLEIAELLERLIRQAVAADQVTEAKVLLATLQPRLFDAVVLEDLAGLVDAQEARDREARERQRLALLADQQSASLRAQLGISCLRLDLAALQASIAALTALSAEQRALLETEVGQRLGDCIGQLAELDPDRAHAMQRDAANLLDERLLALVDAAVDPCGLTYLVGNGAQAGRRGTCHDEIGSGESGPRLVVVPAADGAGRFAMTKEEISWDEFKRFCDETGPEGPCTGVDVPTADPQLPVTGVSLEIARAYAAWLTETTGFTYRLPTSAEWLSAARGEPDPNRNCRVQLDGVERGHSPVAVGAGSGNQYGLVHMLGNVQEWVVDDDTVTAVGGAFSDPIAKCVAGTARVHAGQPAADTGFRLVREVS